MVRMAKRVPSNLVLFVIHTSVEPYVNLTSQSSTMTLGSLSSPKMEIRCIKAILPVRSSEPLHDSSLLQICRLLETSRKQMPQLESQCNFTKPALAALVLVPFFQKTKFDTNAKSSPKHFLQLVFYRTPTRISKAVRWIACFIICRSQVVSTSV